MRASCNGTGTSRQPAVHDQQLLLFTILINQGNALSTSSSTVPHPFSRKASARFSPSLDSWLSSSLDDWELSLREASKACLHSGHLPFGCDCLRWKRAWHLKWNTFAQQPQIALALLKIVMHVLARVLKLGTTSGLSCVHATRSTSLCLPDENYSPPLRKGIAFISLWASFESDPFGTLR